MRKIQMVDLNAQYENIGAEIDAAIKRVLTSTRFIKGPEVGIFEDELCNYQGCRHVISCGNGTDALQLSLMALGLNPGDEVITSDFTFIASAEVIALLGLKPVLVDVDPHNFTVSTEGILKAISSKTKAIIPVHLFGQCADMEVILKIAREYGLYVIEDSAQATGAEYRFSDGTHKKAGTIGNTGTTSFFPSKNLSCCGDGGAVFTDDDDLANRIRCIANHGSRIKYHNDTVGVNSRLDTIQAAILSVKLKYLDKYNMARKKAADFYDKKLKECPSIVVPCRESYSTHIFHQYTIRVKNGKRQALKDYLAAAGIPSMIYYPLPVHLQKAYSNTGYNKTDFPVSLLLCNEVLSLPVYPEIEEEQLDFITRKILDFFA